MAPPWAATRDSFVALLLPRSAPVCAGPRFRLYAEAQHKYTQERDAAATAAPPVPAAKTAKAS
jgi:hypothetical protein